MAQGEVLGPSGPPLGYASAPPPPENSKTKKDTDKRQTALDRPSQVLQRILRSFFDQVKFEVTEGQKKVKFSQNRTIFAENRNYLNNCTS